MFRTWIAAACASLALGAQAQTTDKASTPVLNKVGEVAVYETDDRTERKKYEETVTIVAVEGDKLRTQHVRSDRPAPLEGLYGLDWTTYTSGTTGTKMIRPPRDSMLPLDVGKQWEEDYEGLVTNGARIRVKMASRVAAREKIPTPAGEFDTYRIESSGYVSGLSFQGGFGFQQKVWFAPAINRMVKTEFREQRARGADYASVLKAFKPAQ